MSPRAACRLEALGFTELYDYVAGKADFVVSGGFDDLSTEGIALATSGGFIDDIQDDIDGYAQQIIDGTITVPSK